MGMVQGVRGAIGGAYLDQAFHDQDFGPYDKGRFDGMLFVVNRVFEVLDQVEEDDVPF